MSNSKLALTISPTLTDHPRANLVPWKLAINRAARGVFAEWDAYGFLFAVCDDALWALLNTPPGGPLRARPDFPEPAALAAGANPAARDAFKRATESRAALLACAASFLLAILDSIGEANRLAISDPHRSPDRHPPSYPAWRHHCDDCPPRGDDGCRGRRPASTSEEKALCCV